MKRVMITGACGLVGSHTVAALLRENSTTEKYMPIAVAHNEHSWERLDWQVEWRGLDRTGYLREVAELEYLDDCRRLLRDHRPEILFHCAARVSLGRLRDGERLVRHNVELTHNLVTAALELPVEARPLFVHVSSIASLGGTAGPSGCLDESSVMENLSGSSPYARSKFLSENELWRGAAHGLPVVVVNPSVVIGTMSPTSGFWLNGLFRAARRGRNRFWLDCEAAFVAADDVARAMLLLAEQPEAWGKRYVLSAEQIAYRQFLGQIARSVGQSEPTCKIPRWMLRIAVPFVPSLASLIAPHARIDGSSILRAVPFRYRDWRETLAEVAEAVNKHG